VLSGYAGVYNTGTWAQPLDLRGDRVEIKTMPEVPTIDARLARFVVDDLRRRRTPVDGLLKEVGLQKTDLARPEGRLPHAPVIRLIERAASLVGDPNYGLHLAASLDPRDHGLLGFLALNSPTLIDALINLQRYYKVAREGEFEIERYGTQVVVRLREADPALRGLRQNSDFVVATVVRGCQHLTRQAVSPIRVEFVFEEPNAKVEYADILGCPVKFGAEWTALIYAEETMRLPVKGADTKLLQILELACQKIAGPTPEMQDFVREVRELIVERLPRGSANIDAIADELAMSSKTLERRLAKRNESFSALLDGTRYKAAKHYLEETDMPISQVAYMAGYTEAAALVRAFKRWTGATPMQFRDAADRSTRDG
jgi:AraC-like DNA-binding protein